MATQEQPSESPTTENVWQDHWPSVAYTTDYAHETNKQLNPQTIEEILDDSGLEQPDISGLTVLAAKRPKQLFSNFRSAEYGTLNGSPALLLPYQPDARKAVRKLLHETSHHKDALSGNNTGMSEKKRRLLGRVMGVGFVAITAAVEYRLGFFDTMKETVRSTVGNLALLYGATQVGAFVGHRLGAEERRAIKAGKNKELIDKHASSLYLEQ